MAKSTPLYVGLDVHKDSIAVAHATGGRTDPPVFVGEVGTRQVDIDRLVGRLQSKTAQLRLVLKPARVGTACIGISRRRGGRATSWLRPSSRDGPATR